MSKDEKISSTDSGTGTRNKGNINVSGNGTFIGRDQKIEKHSSMSKLEIIIPIIIALIVLAGTIFTAIMNYTTEIDKIKLPIQLTQTAEMPQITSTLTLPIPSNTPPTLTPMISATP